MLRGRSAVTFVSSVSSEAASSRCFLGPRRVDRYKSLLAGAPACLLDGLQSVLNAAARLICNRGSMTTSHRSSAMFSTGCQSHSASSTSSVFSSFNHYTELLQSTCAISALGHVPPRLGYVYDHLKRPISGFGGLGRTSAIVLSPPPVLDTGTVSFLLFVLLT